MLHKNSHFLITWSFMVDTSLSAPPTTSLMLGKISVFSKKSPPITSKTKYCDRPPSFPAIHTTSNIVSLRTSHAFGLSGGSKRNHTVLMRSFRLDLSMYLLAGSICIKHGAACLPTTLLAQQANVISSESVWGKYVTVLTKPFDCILEFST